MDLHDPTAPASPLRRSVRPRPSSTIAAHFGVLRAAMHSLFPSRMPDVCVHCGGDQVSDIVKNAERQGKAAGRTKTTHRSSTYFCAKSRCFARRHCRR
ncbi:hypothetical protein Zmor_024412 [Zophobas morio]|uniref:Uncharacterized protein n=1 Tax=Zophobas morio TaxID=2755281 RepID=A0AA38HYH5_9CUCU|nr:hypothetical protein Zmor_024412 [Zophobas morio]